MSKYVIMGVQGSGKGTQAKIFARGYRLTHLSVGDIFRWHIQKKTSLGTKIRDLVDSGHLVSDDIVEMIVASRLEEDDCSSGFIIDGFPRNQAQAIFLLDRYRIDAVIHIDIDDQVVLKRMLGRRLCSGCGRDYNLEYIPSAVDGICDDCGADLITRPDDNEEAIRERIAAYHGKTEPVLALFRNRTKVVHVDGARPPETVQADIRKQLGLKEP